MHKISTIVLAVTLAMTSLIVIRPATAQSGVKIEHLGSNNTLVRVVSEGKYLILPIEDSNDEAEVNVLVNGNLDKTLRVRLAKSRVDYTVPLNIEEYADKQVVLNIITSQDRSSVREIKSDACWEHFEVSDSFDTTNREKFRPAYHHTPLYGWMNDPNGMYYKDGVWHLAFQWNPYGSKWQNLSWGQSISRDLIHWETELDPVIEPDGLGMIFSGSAAIDRTNSAGFGKDAVIAMYTSASASQVQSLGWRNDKCRTYNIYEGNPVLTLESEARDPKIFWSSEHHEWIMILAHALEHEMLIFSSPDLKEWTLQSHFGKGLGAQDGVWECPDLFELSVEGSTEKKWVLLCNLNPGGIHGGSATQYFVGDFDGKVFTPDLDADGNVPTKWLDFGKDHYATVSFSDAPDGRRAVIGWMSNWQYAAEVPTLQYRSANTLPREMGLFRGEDSQLYVSSVPSPELLSLRQGEVKRVQNKSITNAPQSFAIPELCEIQLTIAPLKADAISFRISNNLDEHVDLVYSISDGKLSFDRRESGLVSFSQDFPCITYAPVMSSDDTLTLRIFIDRSSIEVFGNNGRFTMTNLVFPNAPYSTLSIQSHGSTSKISELTIFNINDK